MSRGFIKEGDQEEVPFIPPRAYLPPGVTNYVTQEGLNSLWQEKQALLDELTHVQGNNEYERRITSNFINAKLQLLDERIYSARVIKLSEQPKNEIRFGAVVELLIQESNEVQTLQLTGVDEAAASKGKISFISPLAKALINKKIGDKLIFKRANGEVVYVVKNITY